MATTVDMASVVGHGGSGKRERCLRLVGSERLAKTWKQSLAVGAGAVADTNGDFGRDGPRYRRRACSAALGSM
eukprot:11725303-Alexandrium_andersonii.AAC.1